jgi:hypothetical protein
MVADSGIGGPALQPKTHGDFKRLSVLRVQADGIEGKTPLCAPEPISSVFAKANRQLQLAS